MIRANPNLEIRLRPSLTININTALLNHAPRFSHRRYHPELDQKLRQLPRSRRQRSLFDIFRRLLVTKHRIELFLSLARFGLGIEISHDVFREFHFDVTRVASTTTQRSDLRDRKIRAQLVVAP